MSHGMLECDNVMLQNYMLMILSLKRALFVPDPVGDPFPTDKTPISLFIYILLEVF